MKTGFQVKQFKNGASAFLRYNRESHDAPFETYARNANGLIIDKTRCDDYQTAMEYFRAFQRLAKNS